MNGNALAFRQLRSRRSARLLVREMVARGIMIRGMARVRYESKENAGHKFWVARYGRYAIRIDANRPGVYSWLISLEGRMVRKGVAPDRDEAADAVSEAVDELPR